MATQLETTGTLERKLAMAVPVAEIDRQVVERLRKLSRNVRMPGFRPGKVPMKMIERSYGPQVHAEVLGDAVSKAFGAAVDEHQLRVAGQPRIEARDGAAEHELGFTATFEVYPEIVLGDPGALELERVSCRVGEADVERTITILRKQRASWSVPDRAAQDGDRVTIDFTGTIDGVAFQGGSATDFALVLGEGRMLPDFETGVRGAGSGATMTFPVVFPPEYGSVELAGKTAQFEVTLKKIEAPQLPEVDEAFARQLGVPDGDLARMRADVRANLEREVEQRVRARNKSAAMQAIAGLADFELPKALVDTESSALGERAVEDLRQRGVDPKNLPPIPPDTFRDQAERRVRLGLIVGEIVRANALQARPDQIRRQIEEFARTYENPAEVVRHYFSDRKRLAEVEAIVVEQNVVDWVLSKARIVERELAFEQLMSAG